MLEERRIERVARPYSRALAIALLAGAVVIGATVTYDARIAAAGFLIASLLLFFLRSEHKPEATVGVYWMSLCFYDTIGASFEITGFFYPFYAILFANLVLIAQSSGLRFRKAPIVLLAAFLFVVAISFVGFMQPIDVGVIQKVLAFVLGAVIYLQFRSQRGLQVVLAMGVITSLVIAGWAITSAAAGGFGYRADIDVNQNLVAFYVGLGFVLVIALVVQAPKAIHSFWLFLITGILAYSMLLLASRGTTIAIGLVVASIVIRLAIKEPRRLLPMLMLVLLSLGGLLLPGGGGLVERFTEERGIETANDRTPIWEVVFDDYRQGTPWELIAGNGFNSSKGLVQTSFGTLTSTHNSYLEILYEFGLLGLGLFLGLHVMALLVSWNVEGVLGLAMFGLIVFLLGVNLTGTTTDSFVYWVVLAFVLAIGTWGVRYRGLQRRSIAIS